MYVAGHVHVTPCVSVSVVALCLAGYLAYFIIKVQVAAAVPASKISVREEFDMPLPNFFVCPMDSSQQLRNTSIYMAKAGANVQSVDHVIGSVINARLGIEQQNCLVVQRGYVLGDRADTMLLNYACDRYATLLVGFWTHRNAAGRPILDRTILISPLTIALVQVTAQRRVFIDSTSQVNYTLSSTEGPQNPAQAFGSLYFVFMSETVVSVLEFINFTWLDLLGSMVGISGALFGIVIFLSGTSTTAGWRGVCTFS